MKTIGELIDAGVISRETKVTRDLIILASGEIACIGDEVFHPEMDQGLPTTMEIRLVEEWMSNDKDCPEEFRELHVIAFRGYYEPDVGYGVTEYFKPSECYSTLEAAQAALAAKETK